MTPAIFLDRDGVINENRADYVRSWQDVVLIPQALAALRAVAPLPHKIIVVTNQSAIGRGLLSLADAEMINRRLVAEVQAQGGRIDAVFMCPHAPEARCVCRKPKPGMLLQAAEQWQLDLSQAVMVGDALSDVQAGQAAGVRMAALVLSGRGKEQVKNAAALPPFPIYPTLAEALQDLILRPV